jgi:hypothetical protein
VQLFSLSCELATNRSTEHTLNVTETSTTIKHLIPYSRYWISVFAENTKLKGLLSQFSVRTLPEVTVFPSMRGVNITLSNNCNKIRQVTLIAICTNEWCRNQNRAPKRTKYYYNHTITKNGLTPFSDYSADLIFCDFFNHDRDEYTTRKNFRTKPTSN